MNWHLTFTGWPWWLVLPAAGLVAWAILRVQRDDVATVPHPARRNLQLLRAGAAALLVLFLLEPTLSRRTTEQVLPLVGVLVDRSGSMSLKDELMAPTDKLGEALALGLLPASERPAKKPEAAQKQADEALVANARPGSPVAGALTNLSQFSRYERALKLTELRVLPALEGKARVKLFAMDTTAAAMDKAKPEKLLLSSATDFGGALGALSKPWAQEYVGGVVLVTDGRQTAGTDPLPTIRSLQARGAKVAGVLVGDPGTPPDAAVAELSGTSEVFPGESIPLTARYRITGAPGLDWNLVLSHDGQEVERRTLRGNDQWAYETFTVTSTNTGMNRYQARLELAKDDALEWPLAAGSVTLETWQNIAGNAVDDFRGRAQSKPDATSSFNQLAYSNRGQNYGARIRGFLLPPQSGAYRFGICSDDASELWLSASEKPEEKAKICEVAGFVPSGKWDQDPKQKSRPLTLKKGQPYYFEILHKQGGGEDHLAVDWSLPDESRERPIPGSRLAPFDPAASARIAAKRSEARKQTNTWHEASLANNSATKFVAVNRDPIKVLLVDSTPRWESRYLAALFERDRRVNFTRRYHSVLLDENASRLLPQSQAEWDSYDMVVLGDLDSNELPRQQQLWLANYVARRGGFLACIAGPRGMPKAFSLGTLANLLPVRVSLQSGRETEPLTSILTAEGAEHPIMQVLNEPAYNQKLWPLLPPLQWVADFSIAKPGASVLLCAQNPARTPLVAVQRYGAGRVFWMGTEESWRWRDRLGERVHQTFWLQVMRWGLAGRLHGARPELQVGLDRYMLANGETAELKARVSNQKGEPLADPPTVTLERLAENGQPIAASTKQVSMLPMPDAPGLWRMTLGNLEEGVWRMTTTHSHPDLKGYSELREVSVRDGNGLEELELGADFAGLNRMAAAGGLRAASADGCEALIKEFASGLQPRKQERRQTLRLWNNYVSMIIVMTLLCTEWVLRKRHGLA